MNGGLFDLSGRGAVVTGGNGGIGLGMADGLARCGASVAVWGTNEAKNQAAVERLRGHGGTVVAVRCDVSDEQDVRRAHEQTLEALGPVHACFANAGVGGGARGPFWEMPTADWERVLRVNLHGVFFTLREFAAGMVERGRGGSLVVTSSVASVDGAPRGEHYAASKGGVNAMVRGLAVELARHDIRANTILPGWIDTPMTRGAARRPDDARPGAEAGPGTAVGHPRGLRGGGGLPRERRELLRHRSGAGHRWGLHGLLSPWGGYTVHGLLSPCGGLHGLLSPCLF